MTEVRTPTLADALTLPCGASVANRLAKAAMSEQLGDLAGRPTEELVRLYARWARGGLGLSITGNVMVDGRSLGEPKNVVVEDDRDHAMLARWAAAAKGDGTTAIVQVNHPGRQTLPMLSKQVVAPSAIRSRAAGPAMPTPRALTHEEVLDQAARFARTAQVVCDAGFDGVQLHGAHGYLISQFLSPLANRRDDEWGGDAERRRRFLLEVARATRAAIGPERILAVKLNSADFQRGGFDEDESLEAIAALAAEGIDLLEISGGTYERPVMVGLDDGRAASTKAREAYFLAFAERAREVFSGPLMVTGGFRSGSGMAEALTTGAVDLIGLARPLALEPDLPAALLRDPEGTAAQLGPIRTGIAKLDGVAELKWAGHQLARMGDGKEPDPRYGARRAILDTLLVDGLNTLRRRRGI